MSQVGTCAPEVVRFSVFELDRRTQELRKQGRKLKLEGQPVLLLDLLIRNSGEVVTREEVRRALWPDDTFVDFEHGINAAVKRLRQALDDSAETPRFVETIPKRGYRFIYPLNGNAPGKQARPRGRRLWALIASLLAITVTAFSALLLTDTAGLRSRWFRQSQPITSIAVLPFKNLSVDPRDEYLADGLTEDLITDLSHLSALRKVTSRTSSMALKDTRKSVAEVRKELGVDAVIEGSVTREGDRVRVVVQLIDSATDRHLWSERYERDVTSALDLRGDIARQVAQQIDLKLTPAESARLANRKPVSQEAQYAYVKARYLRSKWNDTANLSSAIEFYDQAIQRQPDFAAAHAERSLTYLYLAAALMEVNRPADIIEKARASARRAVELDPTSAEAQEALGWLAHNHDWDWKAAEQAYRKAIELNPNYAPPYVWLGQLLAVKGTPREAPALTERAHELDPLSPHIHWALAEAYMLAGNLAEAEKQCREAIRLHEDFWPAHALLANVYLWRGDFARAAASAARAVEISKRHPYALGVLASVYGLGGEREEALAVVQELKTISQAKYVAPPVMVRAYASLGERREAVAWLRKAYEQRWAEAPRVPLWGPVVDSLRGYQPYEQLLKEMNVPTN